MRTWIHLSPEVQAAATWQAKHGYDGRVGTPLPNLMSLEAVNEINTHLVLFRLAVHMAYTPNQRGT